DERLLDIEKLSREFNAPREPNFYAWTVRTIGAGIARFGANVPTKSEVASLADWARKADSPVKRLALASVAVNIQPRFRWEIVEALASHSEDASDHNLPLM